MSTRQATPAEAVKKSMESAVRAYLGFLSDPSSVVDTESLEELQRKLVDIDDPVEKLRVMAEIDRLTPRGAVLEREFVKVAKRWALVESIPTSAFKQAGVPDGVLRQAGLLPADQRASHHARRAGTTRVTVVDIKLWAANQPRAFTIRQVTEEIGGSLVTVGKALQEMIAEGKLEDIGPDPAHRGPGPAPSRFITV